ncbi:MAG: hypothetical protein H6819_10865 [Phycisphaerales bacterium]|nr:hypothetical protein [Phycisphaerales bacterium]MCB9855614.1 hypothetical protein [Phycisphaerales bacterium]
MMSSCPTHDMLQRYAGDDCESTAAREIETHALSCRRCAATLAELTGRDGLLEEFRAAVEQADSAIAGEVVLDRLQRRIESTLFGDSQ